MKKQQVLLIDGGFSKINFKDYNDALNKFCPVLEEDKWLNNIQKDLGEEYDIMIANMPVPIYADYDEWKITFEKIFPKLHDGLIIVAHSLGTSFVVKYLEENIIPFKLKEIILVSVIYEDTETEKLGNFKTQKTLSNIYTYQDKLTFIHSKDDDVAPIGQLYKLKDSLPKAKYLILDGRGHFNSDRFSELVNYIKNLI